VVPDGITVESGITGRAIRLGRAQLAPDVATDPDYVAALPGIVSELAVPLRSGRLTVGVLNVEAERALPDGAADALRPLARALAPLVEAVRASRTLDLAALARLFVHLGSLRDPHDLAALGAASLPKVLPVETSQLVVWDELGAARELAVWQAEGAVQAPLSERELESARAQTDPSVVCHVVELDGVGRRDRTRSVVWLPLRANAGDIGALVGISRGAERVDPAVLDTAAVLAAHVAASLDAAFSLQRERLSAATDPLTRILNRRGFEERLELALRNAQERRQPLSLLVIDCDDFKEINDRAGHEFGDTLLREIADVLVRALPRRRRGGADRRRRVRRHAPRSGCRRGGRPRQPDPYAPRGGADDAGFPLRISAGISTYPFDGAKADIPPSGRRPGPLRSEVVRQGSSRVVPRAVRAGARAHVRVHPGRARGRSSRA
jgi:GGDEF domain-containing protein